MCKNEKYNRTCGVSIVKIVQNCPKLGNLATCIKYDFPNLFSAIEEIGICGLVMHVHKICKFIWILLN